MYKHFYCFQRRILFMTGRRNQNMLILIGKCAYFARRVKNHKVISCNILLTLFPSGVITFSFYPLDSFWPNIMALWCAVHFLWASRRSGRFSYIFPFKRQNTKMLIISLKMPRMTSYLHHKTISRRETFWWKSKIQAILEPTTEKG